MQRKLVVLFCLVLLAFAGLSVRLILINRDNGDSYKKQVLSQQQYSSTTIPYKRGEILDNKGTKLASSEKVYDLVLDIKQIKRTMLSLRSRHWRIILALTAIRCALMRRNTRIPSIMSSKRECPTMKSVIISR